MRGHACKSRLSVIVRLMGCEKRSRRVWKEIDAERDRVSHEKNEKNRERRVEGERPEPGVNGKVPKGGSLEPLEKSNQGDSKGAGPAVKGSPGQGKCKGKYG